MNFFTQETVTDLTGVLDEGLGPWEYATAAIIFAVAVIVGRGVRYALHRVVDRSRADSFLGNLFGRIANYLIVSFGLIYALESLGIAVAPILGALGIAGIALAFALQDLLENFVAGIMLQLRRPFTAGDEIESGDHEGTVTEVDARTVTIATPDGETIRLPSAEVMKNPIINHTQRGKRRTTIDVGVAYDTNLADAVAIATRAAESVESVHASPPPEALIHTFGTSSIDLAVRFWHEPSIADRWHTRHAVAHAIATAFTENDIEIPFPQRVLHGLDLPG